MPPTGTILVTGANGGLGSAIVSQIVTTPSLAADYHGLYTVHNTQTATTAAGILAKATLRPPQQHELVALDLCRRHPCAPLRAGTLPPLRALSSSTPAGRSTRRARAPRMVSTLAFQANYLGHFLLLQQSLDKTEGRIVVMGSWSHE
jgi:NAD(P)-dependent dehydrogenase (short-subunit alcohol dehydrogenase family)